ncbi:hypothetical protein INT48_001350 [Thamnidium elegans]|uniref:Uncharacterized protein n=1 Tax=Thamnidium elegans TaxID=101142 RepID=A0A8H7VYP5_9FUNG|nr:hypothetical protein INT48_001350 [Thamnidium elegans]
MTEGGYTTGFITPLIDLTLKPCNIKVVFKPGEQKLLLGKEYENSALTEDDVRLPGPNIEGIIKNINLDIPFSLVEVSGSPIIPMTITIITKGNRNKLAKNLKYLFKVIISMKGMPSFKSACKIKFFGIHVYCDQAYVYSMSMPMWDPCSPFYPTNLISKLFQLGAA